MTDANVSRPGTSADVGTAAGQAQSGCTGVTCPFVAAREPGTLVLCEQWQHARSCPQHERLASAGADVVSPSQQVNCAGRITTARSATSVTNDMTR